jgi:predicted nucleotidyltransferase
MSSDRRSSVGATRQPDEVAHVTTTIGPRLFGSLARGNSDQKSDVDILIDFRQPAPEGFAYFGALDQLEQELGQLLGTQVHVTVIDPSSPNGRKLLSEALPL